MLAVTVMVVTPPWTGPAGPPEGKRKLQYCPLAYRDVLLKIRRCIECHDLSMIHYTYVFAEQVCFGHHVSG